MGLQGNIYQTGREFCRTYFALRGLPRNRFATLLEDVKQFTELGEFFDEKIVTYSSGMIARLFFGTVTVVPSEIILLDEILCVGDEHFQGKSLKRMLRFIGRGASALMASHDWVTTLRMCSRVIILKNGSIDYLGPSQEAVRRYLAPDIKITERVKFSSREDLLRTEAPFRPGGEFSFAFQFEVTEPLPVEVRMALEAPPHILSLVLCKGWSRKLEAGSYLATCRISRFPVALQECVISLFLSKPREAGQHSTDEVYDTMSLTHGQSIRLVRQTPPASCGVVHLPLRWKRVG
jgi:energy-coupling factor transporter ATP-binding protein EcfA2